MAIDKDSISTASTNRRSPSQTRSRERVEKLLLTVKALIEEQGISRLKISDIATRASVSPSSIYQYFSDKESIILALAEHYMAIIRRMLEQNLEQLNSLEQLPSLLEKNFLDIYQLHCQEPALREIWFESIDPKLNQLAFEETQRNVDLTMATLSQLANKETLEELARLVLVGSHQFSAIMRLCFVTDELEAKKLIKIQTEMLLSALKEYTL